MRRLVTSLALILILGCVPSGTVQLQAPDRVGRPVSRAALHVLDDSTVVIHGVLLTPAGEVISTSFSGVIVGFSDGETRVLTVAHGCNTHPNIPLGFSMSNDGITFSPAYVVKVAADVEKDGDLCLMGADIDGTPVQLHGNDHVDFGEPIYGIGSPMGTSRFPVFGYYVDDVPDKGLCLLSMPISGGFSGGPIMYRNRLVSIVMAYLPGLANGALGVSTSHIRTFLHDAGKLQPSK